MATSDASAPVLLNIDARGVAQVVLNRPERNNAYDGDLIQALLAALDELEKASGLRAVVISGAGRHFQAGADLRWIAAVRAASREDNIAVSRATAQAIWRLNRAPVPVIALVQGACFGGGTGLLAACDVVIAAEDCDFFHRRSALGPDRGDHHPAAQRRHRRAPGAPLRADRRALRRR